jgi:glycosyltransferase involved in cell wall biosynthesis
MSASVIIPTYNGKHRLANVLHSLSGQTIKEFEVIVVIDGSTDGTEEWLKALKTDLHLSIHVQENKGRAAVRNKGASLAKGELLIFFDDDMRPESSCVEEHLKHHKVYFNSIMTGAQIDDYNAATTDFQKYKCWISRNWVRRLIQENGKPLPLDQLHLTAANFSLPKALFKQLGGFDEALRDAEDFDLAVRAFQSGIPVYYNHNAFAWHDDFVTLRTYIKRLREYNQAHQKLRAIKPAVYKDVSLRKPVVLTGLKKQVFSFFTMPLWIRLIEPHNRLLVLPKRVRYKVYDLITTSQGVFFPEHTLPPA